MRTVFVGTAFSFLFSTSAFAQDQEDRQADVEAPKVGKFKAENLKLFFYDEKGTELLRFKKVA